MVIKKLSLSATSLNSFDHFPLLCRYLYQGRVEKGNKKFEFEWGAIWAWGYLGNEWKGNGKEERGGEGGGGGGGNLWLKGFLESFQRGGQQRLVHQGDFLHL